MAPIRNTSDFDPKADVWRSVELAYRLIRQRVAAGGPIWVPKGEMTDDA